MAAAPALLLLLMALCWPFTVDDAFITLRYSRNLAAGYGPTFNPGEPPVEGYTSVLWMVLLAIPHLLGLEAVLAAKLLGIACTLASVAVACRLAEEWAAPEPANGTHTAGAFAVLALCAFPPLAVHAVSGMETALFTLLLVSLLLVAGRQLRAPAPRRWTRVAVCALLLGLARPEGNLAAGAVLAALFAVAPEDRAALARSATRYYILPGAAYFAWRWSYYGHPFPLPFYIKVEAATGLAGLPYVTSYLLHFALPLAPFAVIAVASAPRQTLAAAVAVVSLVGFFASAEPIMGFEWRYLAPTAPVWVALAGDGVARVVARLPGTTERRAAGLALAALTAGWFASRGPGVVAGLRKYAEGLDRAHLALATNLRREGGGHRLLAIGDAGAVPYYSGWRTLDTYGLNDASIAVNGRPPPENLLARHPDVLVLISFAPDHFEPRLEWEGGLYTAALSAGYRVRETLQFNERYYLWVLAKGSPSAGRGLGQ